MASNESTGFLAGVRPSRRSFLLGAGLIAATPVIDACASSTLTGPTVQLYGRNGSFGQLAARSRLTSGQTFATAPVAGWGFGPGQAAYMSAVTSAGSVVVATTPYTDNQMEPTGTTMELGCLIPGTRRFSRVVVPSTRGKTSLVGAGSRYGGGDIGDVQVVGSGANERVTFVSAMPYHGWDVNADGLLPSFGALRPLAGGGLTFDSSRELTANQMARGTNSMRMPRMSNSYGQELSNSRGLCEMALLPASGHIVVTQYFGPSMQNQQGGILVLDQGGQIKASWQYPAASYKGQSVKCLVREVESDPTGRIGDERFVIICDSFDPNDNPVPFPAQEFSYNSRSAVITPVSVPFQAAAGGSRNESAKYGVDGTLYVARTRANGLSADRVAVYRKGRLGRVAPAGAGWATNSWNRVVNPDQFVSASENTGLVRSMSVDPVSGAVLIAGLNGDLIAIQGAVGRARVTASLDLGLGQLVDRNWHNVGVRKGAVDGARRALWLPIPQLDMSGTYPKTSYPRLDQWLYRVNLAEFVGG